jgi:hypothetical protein
MEPKDKTILEIARRAHASGGQLFDELSQGIASGTISRGRAIKLAGSALLGAALVPFAATPAEARRRRNRCKGKPAISNDRCPEEDAVCRQSADQICSCARTVEGGKRCVDITEEECPTTDECDRTSDCPGNQICIEVGACCEGSPRNLCVRPC